MNYYFPIAAALLFFGLSAQDMAAADMSISYDSGKREFSLLIVNGYSFPVSIAATVEKMDVKIIYGNKKYYQKRYIMMLDEGGTGRGETISISPGGRNKESFILSNFISSGYSGVDAEEKYLFINNYRSGEVVSVVLSVMSERGPIEMSINTSFRDE